MVKGGYLDNSKSVHDFVKCFLDVPVHIHDTEAREKYYSRVWFLVYSRSTFKSKDLYMRRVYNKFKETYK
jgi:hypothetical protein